MYVLGCGVLDKALLHELKNASIHM